MKLGFRSLKNDVISMGEWKLLKSLIVIISVLVAIMLISTNSGIQRDLESVPKDISPIMSVPNVPQPAMENITLNVHYGNSAYSLALEVNRTEYQQLQNFSEENPGYLYLFYNFTLGHNNPYRIYSCQLYQDFGSAWFPGITHTLEDLLVLWVANSDSMLSFHNMSYLNSIFSASYNASSFWNEHLQQLTLGAGWVFNHVDFVGSAISALEKLLTSSTEYTQAENFVMFLFSMLKGYQSLQAIENENQFNTVTSTLLKYNVVDSSTYSDINAIRGLSQLQNVTVHNLTLSLFRDLYGNSYSSEAVIIGTSVVRTFINDSSSMGLDGALQVAGNIATQESVDDSLMLALSDVSFSFITICLPLAMIATFGNLINKVIQIPLNYIGVEYHIEKDVYQNLTARYAYSIKHLLYNGEPDLKSMQDAADYYVIILSFISLWYYVNMHLNSGNNTTKQRDINSFYMASKMIDNFNTEASSLLNN